MLLKLRRARAIAAALVPAVLLAAGALTVLAAPAQAIAPSTLNAGQSIVAQTANNTLSDPTGEFTLQVVPDMVVLDQYAPLSGPHGPDYTSTDLWMADDGTGLHQSNTDHSVLRMQTDGNLVLYTSTGYPLWASHTERTGSHNRLIVQRDGNLVMYTSANRPVWSTGSTGVLLPAGRRLGSGARMTDVWDVRLHQPPIILTMQRDGNLVYQCGGRIQWYSGTHTAGSSLLMQTDGNLVIYSAAGRPQWNSRTSGHGSYTWLSLRWMQLNGMSGEPYWQIPYPAGC